MLISEWGLEVSRPARRAQAHCVAERLEPDCVRSIHLRLHHRFPALPPPAHRALDRLSAEQTGRGCGGGGPGAAGADTELFVSPLFGNVPSEVGFLREARNQTVRVSVFPR